MGLQELENWAMELGEEVQQGPGHPSSSLQQSHYGFAFLVFMRLGSCWEPHDQSEGRGRPSYYELAEMGLVAASKG